MTQIEVKRLSMIDLLKRWAYTRILELHRKIVAAEKKKHFRDAVAGGLVSVGRHTYGTPAIIWYKGDKNKVVIGSYCSIADDVTIFVGGNHRTDWLTTYPLRYMGGLVDEPEEGVVCSKGDVIIGSDVWIGYGATILSGVAIGHGAVVGARAVVAKPVPPYAIVVGNPGRVAGKRFSDEQIKRLLEIKWWDWPPEIVLANASLLCGSEVEKFCHI